LDRLTPKRRRFVEAYCGEARWNATKAAELAGYKGGTRHSLEAEAWRLLRNVEIKAAVAWLSEQTGLDRSEWAGRISSILRNPGEATRDQLRAAELLGRAAGWLGPDSQVNLTSVEVKSLSDEQLDRLIAQASGRRS
jgi:hypothetical protein